MKIVSATYDLPEKTSVSAFNAKGQRFGMMADEPDLIAWVALGNTIEDFPLPSPTQLWLEDMARTDAGMPRSLEDVLDMTGTTGLAHVTLDKYNAKKTLRATKP